MANKKRGLRANHDPSKFHIDGHAVSDTEGWSEVMAISDDLTAEVRVLFADDPALGLGSVITGLDGTGNPTTDSVTEQLPVALFEPRRTVIITSGDDAKPATDLHTQAALMLGMPRVGYGVYQVRALPQWRLLRTDEGLALHDTDGHLFAHGQLDAASVWVSAAVSQRWVLVLHGPWLGVRVPPGSRAEAYTPVQRRREFTEARRVGLVTGGLVLFEPEAALRR